MGSNAPRDDVLELAAEVQGLKRLVQRLAGTIILATTAIARSVVEARPPEIAKDKTLTETVCINAAAASFTNRLEEPVGEARPLGIAQSAVEGSSGEAWSSWSGAERTPSAGITAVAMPAGGPRPPGIARQSATTESDIAVSSGEAGPSWPRAKSTPSAVGTADARPADETRPGIAKQCATTRPELAESSGGAGLFWSRANGMKSAASTAAVKSAGETRPSRIVKYSVTSESEIELAESFDEEPSTEEVEREMRAQEALWAAREARIGSWRRWH